MIISDSLAHSLLGLVFGATAYSPAATLYFALVTSAPADDGSGYTEVAGGSYARVAKTNNTTNFPAPASREVKNGTDITFPQATAAWGAVVGVAVFTASSGGSAIAYAAFATPETVAINNTVSFAANQLKFRILAN
jgi:hypothetical protein